MLQKMAQTWTLNQVQGDDRLDRQLNIWSNPMIPYVFQRGETISLALDAVAGDPAQVSAIVAQMKAVPAGRTSVPAGASPAASFEIATRAASGDVPAGWSLVIPATASATLSPGSYLADARLTVASGTIITEPVAIRIRDAVTL